jgi:tRNA threonylcarbamoyladenosine biosynthesis protein TsaB
MLNKFIGEMSHQRFLGGCSCVIIPRQESSCQLGILSDANKEHHMSKLLAIDTSTDACSVALYSDGEIFDIHEVIPRQHSARLFSMLQELLPSGDLRAQGVEAIAYASGPGSFTGLRIAASAVQGLAFANQLPAIPVSSLACQAQTAFRQGLVFSGQTVLSMLDARINEVYWAVYRFENDLPVLEQGPHVCAPQSVRPNSMNELVGVGGGLTYVSLLPEHVAACLSAVNVDLLPSARDLIPLALEELTANRVQQASDVAPVYVREEISWKKLADQGKQ